MVELEVLFPWGRIAVGNGSNRMRSLAPTPALRAIADIKERCLRHPAEMFSTRRRGRHVTGKGFESDARKYNRAVLIGWRVLRFTPSMIKTWEAVRDIMEALERP
jgi:hypothetical protein